MTVQKLFPTDCVWLVWGNILCPLWQPGGHQQCEAAGLCHAVPAVQLQGWGHGTTTQGLACRPSHYCHQIPAWRESICNDKIINYQSNGHYVLLSDKQGWIHKRGSTWNGDFKFLQLFNVNPTDVRGHTCHSLTTAQSRTSQIRNLTYVSYEILIYLLRHFHYLKYLIYHTP